MNDSTLGHFRKLADSMAGPEPRDWQWVGPHESQRMFGITEERARGYAERHGGTASRMTGCCVFHQTGGSLSLSCGAERGPSNRTADDAAARLSLAKLSSLVKPSREYLTALLRELDDWRGQIVDTLAQLPEDA